MECTLRDRMTDMMAGYHKKHFKKMKGKGSYLEKYLFFDWESVKLFGK